MTFTEAAAEVLRLAGKPLHYKEITELAIEKNLLSHVGKSPEVTMGARLAALLKKEDKANPIVRVKPGVFALRDWDDKKSSKKKDRAEVEAEVDADVDSGSEVNALEVEAVTRASAPAAAAPAARAGRAAAASFDDEEDDDEEEEEEPKVAAALPSQQRLPLSGEDARRADLAASGAELFDDEEDDDQPILAPPGGGAGAAGTAAGADALTAEGGRRRRRRRRRGRGERGPEGTVAPNDRASTPRLEGRAPNGNGSSASSANHESLGSPIQPTAILTVDHEGVVDATRDPLAPAPRPQVRDRQQIMGGTANGVEANVSVAALGDGEELAGRDLADAALMVLSAFDRNGGPVALRNVVDQLVRRGRLVGDPASAQIQLSASIRADNMRRTAAGQRPRFRFAGPGRLAPTDWSLGGDLARLEADVTAALERYRESARRTMLRRLQELPGHAFLELALLALERVGLTQLKPVRRAGSPGGEAHFSAIHKTGADEIRTAVVLRKDGREIGRERVSDLRGSLHHYGAASAGWLITTGQVLSGAREEASAVAAAPIALYDGLAFARLLEEHDVGVLRTRFHVAIPDLELLEALRG